MEKLTLLQKTTHSIITTELARTHIAQRQVDFLPWDKGHCIRNLARYGQLQTQENLISSCEEEGARCKIHDLFHDTLFDDLLQEHMNSHMAEPFNSCEEMALQNNTEMSDYTTLLVADREPKSTEVKIVESAHIWLEDFRGEASALTVNGLDPQQLREDLNKRLLQTVETFKMDALERFCQEKQGVAEPEEIQDFF